MLLLAQQGKEYLGDTKPCCGCSQNGDRAPIQASIASTAAALVNSLLPNSASHLLLPYAPSPAKGGWCSVETQHQHLLNPLTRCKKWDRKGYTFPIRPRTCLGSARPCPSLKNTAGLTCWEVFVSLGTDFPPMFGNRSLVSLYVWECWCFLNWSLHVFVLVEALQSCADTAR